MFRQEIGKSSIADAVNAFDKTIHDIMLDDVGKYLSNKDRVALAGTCHFFNAVFQPNLSKQASQALLQAIIDDKQNVVEKMLDRNPRLLLAIRPQAFTIQSQFTWQIFKILPTDNPLAIAAKLKKFEMMNVLMRYYEKLEQDPMLGHTARQAKEAGLKAWSFYAIRKTNKNKDEIIIPIEYSNFINELINSFIRENIAAGTNDVRKLSCETEASIRSLLNLLVPKSAIMLNNHIDVELLLLATYRLYDQRFNRFISLEKRRAFGIRVIGLMQSIILPGTAKMFCDNHYFYALDANLIHITDGRPPILPFGHSYYRTCRESLFGLGGQYLLRRTDGEMFSAEIDFTPGTNLDKEIEFFEKIMLYKDKKISRLLQACKPKEQDHEPSTRSVLF